MTVPTSSWSETSPAGSDQINAGDNAVRLAKTQIREVVDVDHDFPSSGQADGVGQHKRCTFQEQANLGTGAVNATILGSQTVSGKGELVYTDEDNNDVQLTVIGTPVAINACTAKTAPVVADLFLLSDSADSYKSKKLTLSNLVNFFYPVGSYYFNDSVSTNPGSLFGVGTWVAVEEYVLAGYKSGSTEFGTAGGTYGSKTHTLITAEMPAHTHDVATSFNAGASSNIKRDNTDAGDVQNLSAKAVSTGGGGAHNNIQPSRTVYMWRRTA